MSAGLLLLYTKLSSDTWAWGIQHKIETCQMYVQWISFTEDERFVITAAEFSTVVKWSLTKGYIFVLFFFHFEIAIRILSQAMFLIQVLT
jgi:hypothetical protein